jgi:hypothetical protein
MWEMKDPRVTKRFALLLALALPCLMLPACNPSGPISPASLLSATATATTAAEQALLPNPNADATLGDTVRLSGGDFVGDQAEITVEEAVATPILAGKRRYSFLVLITGRDPDTFPYNLRDFRLFDDLDFQYQPLFDGGKTPRLEFGNLGPGQQVRGWLTFEGDAATALVDLQYAPALVLEPAAFSFRVP